MQVFVNLINNACDASPDGALISIQGTVQNSLPGDTQTGYTGRKIVVETIDRGKGVDPKLKEQIFEPFFTTKPVGQGTGLGLSLAYSIVTNHNGKLKVVGADPGTRMIVTLPILTQPSEH